MALNTTNAPQPDRANVIWFKPFAGNFFLSAFHNYEAKDYNSPLAPTAKEN